MVDESLFEGHVRVEGASLGRPRAPPAAGVAATDAIGTAGLDTDPSSTAAEPFWRAKRLEELTSEEWESLCDRCGRCCLNKLEDEETGEIFWTEVACRLLDRGSCHCSSYPNRHDFVPDCVELDVEEVISQTYTWLPPTCAYRLIAAGRDLMWWHPLVSGDPDTVHAAGISVRNRVISEEGIPADGFEDHIVDWPGEVPDGAEPFPEK
jgi:uncharacterized cysteine cluster protein YcgN (CxxCxxCC family)